MTDQLAPQEWMTAPETSAVMDALDNAGASVRFVGGCVRDALLGRAVRDIDLATDADPETVMAALRKAGIKTVPTGLSHGTVTAVVDGHPFEITTLRHDVETDGRHATVAFTDDWEADASRRDFTFNALSLEPDGTLHDPFGGRADLQAGRVRFVGEPLQRLTEDVLRLLRFFRFHAYYGKQEPDPAGLAACRAMAPKLTRLSAERVRAELYKLLTAPDPVPALRAMAAVGAAAAVLPVALDIDRLDRLVRRESELGEGLPPPFAPDAVRRLAALLRTDAAGAGDIAGRLKLSNADRDRLVALAAPEIEIPPDAGERALRSLIYRLGIGRFVDLLLLGWARQDGDGRWSGMLALARSWPPPRLPVSGADVRALGIPAGPRVGRLLSAVDDWWMDADFAPDRAACLARLRRLAEKP